MTPARVADISCQSRDGAPRPLLGTQTSCADVCVDDIPPRDQMVLRIADAFRTLRIIGDFSDWFPCRICFNTENEYCDTGKSVKCGHPRSPAPAFPAASGYTLTRGDDGLASTSANGCAASHGCVTRALASRENRTGRSLAAPSGSSSSRWRCSPDAHPRLIWRPRPRTSRVAGPSRGGFKEALAASARPSTIVQTAASTIPSVADRASLPPPASRAVTARERLPSEHSREFLAWARRYDKLRSTARTAVPCAESLRREAVWRINARHIEEHNGRRCVPTPPARLPPANPKPKPKPRQKPKQKPNLLALPARRTGSLMKKGLTRFADMTSEEFTTNAATYSTPLLSVSSRRSSRRAPGRRATRRTSRGVGEERYLASHAADGDELPVAEARDGRGGGGRAFTVREGGHTPGPPSAGWDIRSASRRWGLRGRRTRRVSEERSPTDAKDVERRRRRDVRAPRGGSAPSSGTSASGKRGPLGTNLPTHFDWSDVGTLATSCTRVSAPAAGRTPPPP